MSLNQLDGLRVAANRHISAYKQYLQPLRSSLVIKPDGVILAVGSRHHLPLFCLDVHSSKYISTVVKRVANLFD